MVKYIVRKLDYGYLIGIKKKILYPDQFLTLKRSVNKRGLNFKNKFKIFILKSKYNSYKNIYKFSNIKKIKEKYINFIPNLYLKKYKLKIGNLKRCRNFIFINKIEEAQLNDSFFTKIYSSQKFLYKLFELYFDSKFYFHENLRKLIIKRFNKKFKKKFKFVKKNLKFNLDKKIKFINVYKLKKKKLTKMKTKEEKNKYQIRKKKKYVYINYIIKYIKNLLFKKIIKYKKEEKQIKINKKITKNLIKYKKGLKLKNDHFFNHFNFIIKSNQIKKFDVLNAIKLKELLSYKYYKFKRNSKIPFVNITYHLWKIRSIKLNFYSAKFVISINKYVKNLGDNSSVNHLTYENITKFLTFKKDKLWHKFFLNFIYFFFFKYYNFKILSNYKKIGKKQYKLNLNFFNLGRYNKRQNVHLFESQNSFFFFRFLRMSKKLLDLFKPIKNLFLKNKKKLEIKQNLLYYKILNFYFKKTKCVNNFLIFFLLDIFEIISNITKNFINTKFLNFLLYMVALKQNLYFKNNLKC